MIEIIKRYDQILTFPLRKVNPSDLKSYIAENPEFLPVYISSTAADLLNPDKTADEFFTNYSLEEADKFSRIYGKNLAGVFYFHTRSRRTDSGMVVVAGMLAENCIMDYDRSEAEEYYRFFEQKPWVVNTLACSLNHYSDNPHLKKFRNKTVNVALFGTAYSGNADILADFLNDYKIKGNVNVFDRNFTPLANTHKLINENHPPLVNADINYLPYVLDHKFNIIISDFTVDCMPISLRQTYLHTLRSRLKPDGICLFACLTADGMNFPEAHDLYRFYRGGNGHINQEFITGTYKALLRSLKQADLRIISSFIEQNRELPIGQLYDHRYLILQPD